MSTEPPDWIRVGAKVAEYTYGRIGTTRIGTVERLTATQIILVGGARYRRNTLCPVDGTRDAWAAMVSLKPINDPRVIDALARQRLAAVSAHTERIVRDAGNDVENVLAALDGIEQIVKAARAAIQGRIGNHVGDPRDTA